LIGDVVVALPNRITRKRLPLCGFVQVLFEEVCTGMAVAGFIASNGEVFTYPNPLDYVSAFRKVAAAACR